MSLTNTQQAVLFFVGFFLIALGGISIPVGLPYAVTSILFIIGIVAVTVKEQLGSLTPPTLSNSQQAVLLAIAAVLVSVSSALPTLYPNDVWVALVLGVLGAIVAAIKELDTISTPVPVTTPVAPATKA